jgi:type VI secretion system protein ImpE
MPFNQIGAIEVDAPGDLRDAVWTAATLTLMNGGRVPALIPTRYAGTTERGDDAARLARATLWEDAGGETFVGLGQRLLATDAADVALMDMRLLSMDAFDPSTMMPPDGEADAGAGSGDAAGDG